VVRRGERACARVAASPRAPRRASRAEPLPCAQVQPRAPGRARQGRGCPWRCGAARRAMPRKRPRAGASRLRPRAESTAAPGRSVAFGARGTPQWPGPAAPPKPLRPPLAPRPCCGGPSPLARVVWRARPVNHPKCFRFCHARGGKRWAESTLDRIAIPEKRLCLPLLVVAQTTRCGGLSPHCRG
jgi:hypothetical protein